MLARHIALLTTLAILSACSSFGEGLGRALLRQDTKEDTRQCYVRGPAFNGIEQLITDTEQQGPSGKELKVLMVHGIGRHLPGYSTRLAENLARELDLDVVEREPKVLTLRLTMERPELFDAAVRRGDIRGTLGDRNGTLTVRAFRSKRTERQMVFYELAWSEITDADKRILAFDDSGEYTFRRASTNKELKEFVNAYLPDPLIYLGDAHLNIQLSVSQALCWMFTQDYDQLPKQSDQACRIGEFSPSQVGQDTYVFVSHSLGSRILTDALQTVTASISESYEENATDNLRAWRDALRAEALTIFMLSNQLPLLQLGREAPAVTNQIDDYCAASGKLTEKRVFAKTNIVAFSDPNDILSWAVPPDYEDKNMDSRICPSLVNVIINIAPVKSVLGVELAAPGEAHRGYDNDQRVIKLMAHGMSDDQADPMVKERCTWMEVR